MLGLTEPCARRGLPLQGLGRMRVLGMAACLCAGLGCNALAGIEDGHLVAVDSGGSADSNGGPEAGGGDGANPDGTTSDGGADGTMPGSDGSMPGSDGSPPSDAVAPSDGQPQEAGPLLPVGCAIDPNTTFLVRDLSVGAPDSGLSSNALQFQHQLWVLSANIGDGAYIIAQAQSDYSDFTLYQVSYTQRTATPASLGTSDAGNVRLLDIQPTANGPAALTTYGTQPGMPAQALQVVSLPSTWNGPAGATTPVSGAIPNNGSGGSFVSPRANLYDWIFSAQSGGSDQLISGSNGGQQITVLQTSSTQFSGSAPLLDLDGGLYAFMQGLGDAGGSTVVAYPDDFSSMGVQAPITSSQSPSAVLAAHVSARDSTKAALLALALDQNTGKGQVWAGAVAANQLTNLTLGPAQLTAGSQLSLSEIPFDNGGSSWAGDQLFSIGTPQGGGNTLLLLWFGTEGRAIVRPSVMGPIVSRTNSIVSSAVGSGTVFGEVDATLYIAWVEEIVPDSGQVYDQLWTARATCTVIAGD